MQKRQGALRRQERVGFCDVVGTIAESSRIVAKYLCVRIGVVGRLQCRNNHAVIRETMPREMVLWRRCFESCADKRPRSGHTLRTHCGSAPTRDETASQFVARCHPFAAMQKGH